MELHFVTGKGGVGKSTMAIALALQYSKKGYKTLLVELGMISYVENFLNLSKSIHFNPQSIQSSLDLALWSGPDCLKDYALHLLKLEKLFEIFFENKVAKAFLQAAPALEEISILGKITSGIRKVGPDLPYQVMVIDAFASGHFMALLKASEGLSKAIRFGPMGDQTRSILRILKDQNLTHYHIVTVPDSLSEEEGFELSDQIFNLTGVRSQMYINKILSPIQSAKEQDWKEELKRAESLLKDSREEKYYKEFQGFTAYLKNYFEREQRIFNRIQGLDYKILPWVLKSDPWSIVDELSLSLNGEDDGVIK